MKKLILLLLSPMVMAGYSNHLNVGVGACGVGAAFVRENDDGISSKVAVSTGSPVFNDKPRLMIGATSYKSVYLHRGLHVDIGFGGLVMAESMQKFGVAPMFELGVGVKLHPSTQVKFHFLGATPLSISCQHRFGHYD